MYKIDELLQKAKTVAISGHVRPDGDCVGSVMALYLYIKKNMPEIQAKVFLEKPSDVFYCIPGVEDIDTVMESQEVYDIFFVLDTAADRIGNACPIYERAKLKVNIDHHISNPGTGDINILVPQGSSTSEVVYRNIDPTKLDSSIAMAIYMGIAHDTGVFKYSNTTPDTLRAVAHLMEYGFDFSKLIDETFYEKTYHQNQIMGRAMLESIRFMEGKCVVSTVTKKMMDFYHVTAGDLDGIINQLRIIKGVECAIFLYQVGEMEYKVSLRSNSYVNVSVVASYFGGGGHIRAAGCTMKGTPHDVINNLSARISLQMEKKDKK